MSDPRFEERRHDTDRSFVGRERSDAVGLAAAGVIAAILVVGGIMYYGMSGGTQTASNAPATDQTTPGARPGAPVTPQNK
jgi:hypothetical protein